MLNVIKGKEMALARLISTMARPRTMTGLCQVSMIPKRRCGTSVHVESRDFAVEDLYRL